MTQELSIFLLVPAVLSGMIGKRYSAACAQPLKPAPDQAISPALDRMGSLLPLFSANASRPR
jgi:hypothetical protein